MSSTNDIHVVLKNDTWYCYPDGEWNEAIKIPLSSNLVGLVICKPIAYVVMSCVKKVDYNFLASQDALEVMGVIHSLSESLTDR